MRGLSENPNDAFFFLGNPHYNSIIYATNSDPNDFPVKGYIVGGAQSIWGFSDCVALDFDYTRSWYHRMFLSPNANESVGFISRIENEASSCNREEVNPVTDVVSSPGTGRDDSMSDKPVISDHAEDFYINIDSTYMLDLS